jgi:formylglycine-generating enzyme required for sulfatase activity
MLDIFISYSRQNLDFVHQLANDLTEVGKSIWFDQVKEPLQGIPAGSKWWDEIKHGIETADNFLFVLTPQSIASSYCHAEVAHALKHDKRIIVVLYCSNGTQAQTFQSIDSAIDAISPDMELPATVSADILQVRALARRNWLSISSIQYVPFESDYAWDVSVKQLTEALDLDLQWLRLWGQFRQAVQIWQESNFDSDFLWGEKRRQSMWERISKRGQALNEHEHAFLRPEQERLIEEINNIITSHARRATIGERLSIIGDTRSGIGLTKDLFPDIVWCNVPSGSVAIKDLNNQEHQIDIFSFYIAKFPITNRQFQSFVDHPDGFRSEKWWADFSQEFLQQELLTSRAVFWNSPRDSIAWHQAVAFTRWINYYLPLELLPTNHNPKWVVRLPCEWEWQWAACDKHPQYAYPWGNDWTENRANVLESGLSRAITVGMYPSGVAKCGALDMSGNIWEWCQNEYYNLQTTEVNENNRVMKGGSWYSSFELAKISNRSTNFLLDHKNSNIGFRLVYGQKL